MGPSWLLLFLSSAAADSRRDGFPSGNSGHHGACPGLPAYTGASLAPFPTFKGALCPDNNGAKVFGLHPEQSWSNATHCGLVGKSAVEEPRDAGSNPPLAASAALQHASTPARLLG